MSDNINEEKVYATGAEPSSVDIRDFTYKPDKANKKGGERYNAEDIEDQHRVGICTAISLTQNARKATGIEYSADFQYLLQKKFYDKNWNEGSSARSALHIAKTYGMLPQNEWRHTMESDRKLSYSRYIAKLKNVSDAEIDRLLKIAANYKIAGYAQVPINRDLLAAAVDESAAGLIARFLCGSTWYSSNKEIEPLRMPNPVVSGHLVTYSNYDGMSYRIANTWGDDWADKGTAYSLLQTYQPTEAWIPYYNKLPDPIKEQKEKLESLQGQLLTLLQKLVALLNLKK